jgi:hypothetical protein
MYVFACMHMYVICIGRYCMYWTAGARKPPQRPQNTLLWPQKSNTYTYLLIHANTCSYMHIHTTYMKILTYCMYVYVCVCICRYKHVLSSIRYYMQVSQGISRYVPVCATLQFFVCDVAEKELCWRKNWPTYVCAGICMYCPVLASIHRYQ